MDKAGKIAQVPFFGRKSGWMDVIFISTSVFDDSVDAIGFEAYTKNVNEDKFLCLKPRRLDDANHNTEESFYLLAHYRLSDEGILTIIPFNENPVKEMMKKGLLKGEYKEKEDRLIVESSSEEIESLIARKGYKSFISKEDTVKFRKLK